MLLERQAVQQYFEQHASGYVQRNRLQKQIGQDLVSQLQRHVPQPLHNFIDLGCGSGEVSRLLRKSGICQSLTGCDISPAMLQQWQLRNQGKALQASFDSLPVEAESYAGAFANMALHWASDLSVALAEIHRIVKAGGLLACSIPVTGSLTELQQAYQRQRTQALFPFMSEQAVQQTVSRYFQIIHQHSRRYTLWFDSVPQLLRYLKYSGVMWYPNRFQGLTTPRMLNRMTHAYAQFRQPQGLPLSFKIISLIGMKRCKPIS